MGRGRSNKLAPETDVYVATPMPILGLSISSAPPFTLGGERWQNLTMCNFANTRKQANTFTPQGGGKAFTIFFARA